MRTYVTLLLSVALSLPMTACSEKSTGADIEGVGTHKKEPVNIIGKVTKVSQVNKYQLACL